MTAAEDVRLEFEFVKSEKWSENQQGIDSITFNAEDGSLYVEGWFDSIAGWASGITLSDQDRRTLAGALLAGLV